MEYGRRVFRVLVYTSDTRFSAATLHSNCLPIRRPTNAEARFAGGDLSRTLYDDESIVVIRRDVEQMWIPNSVLRGTLPEAFLHKGMRWWQVLQPACSTSFRDSPA